MSSGEENIKEIEGLKAKKDKKATGGKKWKKIAKNTLKNTHRRNKSKSKISSALERSFNENLDTEDAHNTSVSVTITI